MLNKLIGYSEPPLSTGLKLFRGLSIPELPLLHYLLSADRAARVIKVNSCWNAVDSADIAVTYALKYQTKLMLEFTQNNYWEPFCGHYYSTEDHYLQVDHIYEVRQGIRAYMPFGVDIHDPANIHRYLVEPYIKKIFF